MSCLLFTAGTHIEQVARELVVSALAAGEPVSTNFNGIELVARPGEKAPDIVARFHAERERQAEAFACSAEGRAQAQAGHREIAAGQRSHDTLVSALAGLDWSSDTAVLDWVCALQRATERSGVAVERARIVRAFEAHGFQANANVDQAYDARCRDNAFRWIIGQVLDALKSEKPPHPLLLMFADQWRAAFLPSRGVNAEERRQNILDDIDDRPWIECWSCGGRGSHDDCFEDVCVCLDPPCNEVQCSECKGKGGWYGAPSSALVPARQMGGADA